MKTFSLSMQTSDDPKGALQEIIDSLEELKTELAEEIACGGFVLASGHVLNSRGIVGRWTFDRETTTEAALASYRATAARGEERPDGFTEREWEAAKRLRPGLTRDLWEEETISARYPTLLGRPKKGTTR